MSMTNQGQEELVVLCDEEDNEIGACPKDEVHHRETPLHRAFSVFLFNDKGEVLVQQRAMGKKTWPGVWSNSCCGHPLPNESREEAIARRVKFELGVEVRELNKVSDYRYRFERDGVVENEVCPVYMGKVAGDVRANFDEVMDYKWVNWEEWLEELRSDGSNKWSEWCKEEAELVAQVG